MISSSSSSSSMGSRAGLADPEAVAATSFAIASSPAASATSLPPSWSPSRPSPPPLASPATASRNSSTALFSAFHSLVEASARQEAFWEDASAKLPRWSAIASRSATMRARRRPAKSDGASQPERRSCAGASGRKPRSVTSSGSGAPPGAVVAASERSAGSSAAAAVRKAARAASSGASGSSGSAWAGCAASHCRPTCSAGSAGWPDRVGAPCSAEVSAARKLCATAIAPRASTARCTISLYPGLCPGGAHATLCAANARTAARRSRSSRLGAAPRGLDASPDSAAERSAAAVSARPPNVSRLVLVNRMPTRRT
mmetsp:Transcript_14539/g.37298  ORF Transcript_14539/g.37298 Transcript_14539/m.37298 type:complete len:314 (-) Transcript_14539:1164-2105(-)